MAKDELAHRVEELARQVLAPLVLGGKVTPVRPFGPRLALAIGARRIVDDALRAAVDVARVRRARLYAPVDTLPDPDASEWALVAALNDLLQVTNHELTSPLTRGRHAKLLASVRELCERIPPPPDVRAALSRHATFARALELSRTDTEVSWWTGKARFRGQPPATRLLRWREIRRVHVEQQKVELSAMWDGLGGVDAPVFHDVLASLLSRTPLTDLANLTRREPRFAWTGATIALVMVPPGRSLALRAIARQPADLAAGVLSRAAKELPADAGTVRDAAAAFAADVAARATPEREPAARAR